MADSPVFNDTVSDDSEYDQERGVSTSKRKVDESPSLDRVNS
ncbi:MAG: hypothetical protein WBA22_18340 [Candidatus Methanofastidiosia archaeon]